MVQNNDTILLHRQKLSVSVSTLTATLKYLTTDSKLSYRKKEKASFTPVVTISFRFTVFKTFSATPERVSMASANTVRYP